MNPDLRMFVNVIPWVNGLALLLSGLSADVGSNVKEDSGKGNVDHVSLTEGGGDGELLLLGGKIGGKNEYNSVIRYSVNFKKISWSYVLLNKSY